MTDLPVIFPVEPRRGVPEQRNLGAAVLVLTGLVTLQSIAVALLPAINIRSYTPAGLTFSVDLTQGFGLIGIAAWLVIAQWMSNAARGTASMGYAVKYRPWVAWWGWAIPIWNFWAPYRYMKDAVQGFDVRHLGLWWATWLVGTIVIWTSSGPNTVDAQLTDTQVAWSAPINAIALTVSWIFLARIVWTVSRGSYRTAYSGPVRP